MSSGYYRQPTIHHKHIVFVSDDDLWGVDAKGGVAQRLTSNLGEVSHPALSPDGTKLAFTGREEGPREVYLMPAHGGPAQRLTFMNGDTTVAGWMRDGRIVFGSNAAQPLYQLNWLYTLDCAQPAHPKRLELGPARAIAFGPKRGRVIGRNTSDPARWKRYRGGLAGQLWINITDHGNWRPLINLESNLASPMWLNDGRIYFISDHEGVGNIYSCNVQGRGLRRHTHHADFYARSANSDGARIVYHAGADVYVLDPTREKTHKIEIDFPSPRTQRNRKFVSGASALGDWELGSKGENIAFTARGRLFSAGCFEGPATETGLDARYRLPIFSEDDQAIIAIADEGGEEKLKVLLRDPRILSKPEMSAEIAKVNTALAQLDLGRVQSMRINHARDVLAFTNHRYELGVIDLNNGGATLVPVDCGLTRGIEGFEWSPDGEWLAYACSTGPQSSVIKLWNASTRAITQITDPILHDSMPSWDPSGKYLYYISTRRFAPTWDNTRFEMGFPHAQVPCLIALNKDTSSPFGPPPNIDAPPEKKDGKTRVEGEPTPAPPETPAPDSASTAEPSKPAEENAKTKPDPVQVDLDGIAQRTLAFPISAGVYGRILAAKEGRKVYYTYRYSVDASREYDENSADWDLECYDFDERKEDTLLRGISGFDMNYDHTILAVQTGRTLRVFKAGEKPDESASHPRKRAVVDLDRAKVSVEPAAEWRQMFREAWRLQRDNFWTPDMSGVNWVDVYERYLPLVERASTRSEMTDLLYEMQGELGTSHAYVSGGDFRWHPYYGAGSLGADFDWDETRKGWSVRHIVRGDPASGEQSPLAAPGVNVQTGDILRSINGQALGQNLSPAMALVNQGGNDVALIMEPRDGENSAARQLHIKALHHDRAARFREWVLTNRNRVHERTHNRCGYVYVPDMQAHGYSEFHRAFLRECEHDALIIDDRYNNGGFVSQLLISMLARKRLGYDINRWARNPIPLPYYTVPGPMAMLINEYSASDGDIFPHMFRMMKLGKLIGTRTWGGVIGISPRKLVDGGVVTQPEFSTWFADVGWQIENRGVSPDVVVDNLPQDWAAGHDAQIEAAIAHINQQLKRKPVPVPVFTNRPNLAAPKLKTK